MCPCRILEYLSSTNTPFRSVNDSASAIQSNEYSVAAAMEGATARTTTARWNHTARSMTHLRLDGHNTPIGCQYLRVPPRICLSVGTALCRQGRHAGGYEMSKHPLE